jgi:ABC-type multidrug transport system permease subunit
MVPRMAPQIAPQTDTISEIDIAFAIPASLSPLVFDVSFSYQLIPYMFCCSYKLLTVYALFCFFERFVQYLVY